MAAAASPAAPIDGRWWSKRTNRLFGNARAIGIVELPWPQPTSATAAPRAKLRKMFERTEFLVQRGVEWLRLVVETFGALVIAVGIVVAAASLLRNVARRPRGDFTAIRLSFARYLALALELQLAADILSTAVAPTWDRIGKLGAIAVIRTALNYFLTREMREEGRAAQAEARQ